MELIIDLIAAILGVLGTFFALLLIASLVAMVVAVDELSKKE